MRQSTEGTADDERYEEAKQIVLSKQNASTAHLARVMSIRYNRAESLIKLMEHAGLVSRPDPLKGHRSVLVSAPSSSPLFP